MLSCCRIGQVYIIRWLLSNTLDLVWKRLLPGRVRTDMEKTLNLTLVLENSWNLEKRHFILELSWNFVKLSLKIELVLVKYKNESFQIHGMHKNVEGAQWLSGRVLDSRLRGRRFQPHRPHCVVVLEQDTFIIA